MKSLKENWIISIKQLKCSIYYCNLRKKDFSKLTRILDIIKSSNLIIDDYGNWSNTRDKYLEVVKQIIVGDYCPRIKNKASMILKDLESLKNIKK